MTSLLTSEYFFRLNSPNPFLKKPASFNGDMAGRFSFLPSSKSYAPQPGAICTIPVPSSPDANSQTTTLCGEFFCISRLA